MLPPLNHRLASDLLAGAGIEVSGHALVDLLLRVSALACALPWVRALLLDPITVTRNRLAIPSARIVVDPKRKPAPGYRHMAIHPYPVELESQMVLADGTKLAVRPSGREGGGLRRASSLRCPIERATTVFYRLLCCARDARAVHAGRLRPRARCWRWLPCGEPGVAIVASRYTANVDHEARNLLVVAMLARPRRRDAHEGAHRVREEKPESAPRPGKHRVACTQPEPCRILAAKADSRFDNPDDTEPRSRRAPLR
jgi:hypothetical protein